ncbi:MAG: hypothetical protein KF795_00710 [Labilithrix sp.]|nr:hypothetical protein [Labilithrix sp.]
MKREAAEQALRAFVAGKKLVPTMDRAVVTSARKALSALPAVVDSALVRQAYQRFAREGEYELWRIGHKVRREHAAGYVAAIKPLRSVQSDFVVHAVGAGTGKTLSDAAYDRLMRANRALAKIASFVASAANRAAAERVRFIANDEVLVRAIESTLPRHPNPDLLALSCWLWFVSVLSQSGTRSSSAALEKVVRGAVKAKSTRLDVLARLLGHYRAVAPGVGALVHQLEARKGARDARSAAAALAASLGIEPREERWSFKFVVESKPKKDADFFNPAEPHASVDISAGVDPCFRVEVKTAKGDACFDEHESLGNDLRLPKPRDLVTIRSYLDDVATKLKLTWAWPRAATFGFRLRPSEKERLTAWVREG